MKRIISLLLILILVCTASVSLAGVQNWKIMKNFKVKTLTGETFDLYQALEEKELAVIDLWFIQCPPCMDTACSLEAVYEEYKDRVAFISINPVDSKKAVELFVSSRGITIPCASNSVGRSWTQGYPNVIVVNKDHYIISCNSGIDSPGGARDLIDWGLNMTEEQFQKYSERNMYKFASGKAEDYNAFQAEVYTYYYSYNLKNDLSMTIDCPGMKRVAVDSNLKILQCNAMVGEFYILPESAEKATVTIHTGKGFNAGKAHMVHNSDYESISFKKAAKNKADYTFELELGQWYLENSFTFYASDELGSATKDSYIGVQFFRSEDDLNQFFEDMKRNYHHEFTWHIEDIPEEAPAE